MSAAPLDRFLDAARKGRIEPVYLVHGDLVLAEPKAMALAEAVAERAGCRIERYHRPSSLLQILDDLRTYALFASGKVAVAVDTAVVAERAAAADLIDQAAEALPLGDGSDELDGPRREAASRLIRALRLFGLDPFSGDGGRVLDAVPPWAFRGGSAKGPAGRGRSAKAAETLKADLAVLLSAARRSGLQGHDEGDLARLADAVDRGLPEGHVLILVERTVATDHPLIEQLEQRGTVLRLSSVEAGRRGEWHGTEELMAQLGEDTGVTIEPTAGRELVRRTLKQGSRRRGSGGAADADSTARLAAEYRKLASLAASGSISKALVEEVVEDRGEEDVWQILDAVGEGRGDEALGRYRRLIAAAEDATAARLSFFGLLAAFCRSLTAVSGLASMTGVPAQVTRYPSFRDRWAPELQRDLETGPNPLAKLHPYRLYRAYLAASRRRPEELARLPWEVLETELQIKGESSDPDAAITRLMARVSAASG